jgi:hypothetical protein
MERLGWKMTHMKWKHVRREKRMCEKGLNKWH